MQSIGNGNRSLVYDGKIAGLYDLEETLGSGHFAVVKLARHVFTGEKVAVKVIDKTKLDEVSRAHLFQEVRCMKLVQHPNVVRLYEVIDTQTKLYLILELGDGGDLYDYIMKHEGGLSESLAREYFKQIVRAISYCHQLHVVHRDLKPENVVFFEKLGVVKLTDFGFSNKFCPGQKLETSCGSLAYSAPEILLGDSYDAPAVDIWSLGVILYMLVCGQPPFEKANDSETLTMIMDCKYTMPGHVSSGCRRLISKMLVREPEKRATLKNIAKDSWLEDRSQDDITPEYLPLVSRQQVSEDDHSLIIQKMVNGNIATKEEILDALDRNEYNHITATYFLLTERKLRQHRQEQIQKQRPELSLPVSTTSRLSPRSRLQGIKRDLQSSAKSPNHLLVPSNCIINTPRTPGTDSGSRSRKCSIVQEEDDEDEMPGCSNCNELSAPLNQRGSRSEGRINLAIQDRVAENERIRKETKSSLKSHIKILGGVRDVKLVDNDESNIRLRLGAAGTGRTSYKFQKSDIITSDKSNELSNMSSNIKTSEEKQENLDNKQAKIITESLTITLPLNQTQEINIDTTPKYKTMPSPTRQPTLLITGARALNEIFEEVTDIGSSDSATTTPRSLTRQTHFTTNIINSTSTSNRRSKFHKTRTPSCSSSDASDDDSETRKKRADKIADIVKHKETQRRDSHDDSSDSQDQGNATCSNNTSCTNYVICSNNTKTTDTNSHSNENKTKPANDNSKTQNSNSTYNCQKVDKQIAFRRHRAGRRRAGETRLRESQSLNRITEVQESDFSVVNSNSINSNCNMQSNINSPSPAVINKPKGLSARIFQVFVKKSSNEHIQQTTHYSTNNKEVISQPKGDNIDVVLGVEFAKRIQVTENKSSSATKKLKMLGGYFQVHKKICIPLPGIFQKGRLYKARSCGNIMRDKVNSATLNPLNKTRHSVLFTEKGKMLRNCLSSKFSGSSDSDINQNNGKNKFSNSLFFTMQSPTTQHFNLSANKKSSSPIHHQLNDTPLCSSKC